MIDVRGQTVSSADRLYLAATLPTLLVWGARDPVLPVAHARATMAILPGARLEILPRAGHQPHRSDPERFVRVLEDFLDTTTAATYDEGLWRRTLTAGAATA